MSEAAGKTVDVKQGDANAIRQTKPAQVNNKPRKDLKNDTGSDQAGKTDESSKTSEKDNIKDDTNTKDDISAKVSEKTDKVKDAIKDELSVTDEEIEVAMNALSMTEADLLNPDALKELMLSLTENDDPMSLLTNENLLQSIRNVVELAGEVKGDLMQEFGLTSDEFGAALKELVQNAEAVKDPGMITDEKTEKDEDPVITDRTATQSDLTAAPKAGEKEDKDKNGEVSKTSDNSNGAQALRADNTVTVAKADNNANAGGNNGSDMPREAFTQTVVTTEISSTGEVIETVREYGSYADGANILNQVTEQIKVNISPETTTMEMQLHPASLGAVNVQIASENGVMHAHILVQNESVREVLASQMEQLLKTFEEQGQKVTEIDVSVANYNLEHGLYRDDENNGQAGKESSGRRGRRSIDLNAMSDSDIAELDEEDRLEAEMMDMNGTSVQYRA